MTYIYSTSHFKVFEKKGHEYFQCVFTKNWYKFCPSTYKFILIKGK